MIKFLLKNFRKIFIYLLFTYIIIVLWRLQIWDWPNQLVKNIRNNIKEERSIKTPNCKEYGRNLPVDDYVKNYTVKPGDNLLSIAENELGSSERLYELIQYNKLNGSTIKVGTKLKIPQKKLGVIQGKLMKKAGKINSIDETSIVLINAAANYGDGFSISSQTQMIGKTKFEKDDCVVAILDMDDNKYYRTISIELQK